MSGDIISRQDAIETALTFLVEYCGAAFDEDMQKMLCERLDALPSVEPEEEVFEWCHDCKEYDQEKHCCHRWTKVIRQTLEEMKAEPEMKKGEWIKVGHWGRTYKCNQCGNYLDLSGVNAGRGDANFCPNCGAKMDWSE